MIEPSKTVSVQKLCEAFWKVEESEKLFSLQDEGVYFWRLLRFPLYYAASQRCGLFEAAHPSSAFRMGAFLRRIVPALKAITVYNPLVFNKKVENIVMPHPRRIGGDDIYTQALLAALPAAQTARLYNDYAAEPGTMGINMFAWASVASIKRRFRRLVFKGVAYAPENYKVLNRVREAFERELGVSLPVCQMADVEKEMFSGLLKGYLLLFRKTGARRLYLTSGYTHCAAIAAAQLCGMKVIELQHGVFTRYHLGYSFPQGGAVPYTPDELLCFGKFWPETTPLPALLKTAIIGAPYIVALSAAYHPPPAGRKPIVFTSQGVIGAKLFNFALKVAALLPHENFVFRLHPSEFLEPYITRGEGKIPSNLSLSHREPNIFALLAGAKIQVGVFSTTLFEGMVLGCRTILVDLAGIEYMKPLVGRGDAVLVKTPEEFVAVYQGAPLCADPDYYYDRAASLSLGET